MALRHRCDIISKTFTFLPNYQIFTQENDYPWIAALIREEVNSNTYVNTKCGSSLVVFPYRFYFFLVQNLIFLKKILVWKLNICSCHSILCRLAALGWWLQPTASSKMRSWSMQKHSRFFLDSMTGAKNPKGIGDFSYLSFFCFFLRDVIFSCISF